MFCSIRLKACTGDGVDGLRGNAFIRSRKHTGQLFLHLRFAGAHGFNCHLEQPVKLPAQALCSYTDHIARAARSEFFILKFFLEARYLQIRYAFEGRILTAAPMRPVSSSAAKSTFSISCAGSTSHTRP